VIGGKELSKSIDWNISTHEYIHYELEFNINNLHVLTKEEFWKLMVLDIFVHVEEKTLVVR
jgi:hypothetical protein